MHDAPDAKRPRRILLKLSGEALMGGRSHGIDPAVLGRIADETAEVVASGVRLGVVVGGGNYCRGARLEGLDRVAGDQMGMLATVMNAVALRDALKRRSTPARLLSAFAVGRICEEYVCHQALQRLEQGDLLLFAGGIGAPFFTTDTAACLRAIELNVDEVLKATRVDGVYTADPEVEPDARPLPRLSYAEALSREVAVMDMTALILCRDHGMPLRIFNMNRPGALRDAALFGRGGSVIGDFADAPSGGR